MCKTVDVLGLLQLTKSGLKNRSYTVWLVVIWHKVFEEAPCQSMWFIYWSSWPMWLFRVVDFPNQNSGQSQDFVCQLRRSSKKYSVCVATGVKNACGRTGGQKHSRFFFNHVSNSGAGGNASKTIFRWSSEQLRKSYTLKEQIALPRFFSVSPHWKISGKFDAGGWREKNNFSMTALCGVWVYSPLTSPLQGQHNHTCEFLLLV